MSIQLSSPLNQYAIFSNSIIGNGSIRIENGNYYNSSSVPITSLGTPNGLNVADSSSSLLQLTTLKVSLVNIPYTQSYPAFPYLLNIVITPNVIAFADNLLTTTVTFLQHSVITFDAENDPNAIFVIRASNFIFKNNVTIKLINQAQHTNIFWVTPNEGTISFEGTNPSAFGVFICKYFIGNNLDVKGHIYANESLTVNGTLTIDILNTIDPVVPVSDICFAKNTPIETDQGIVLIQELKPTVHTIRGEPIVAITRTKYVDDCLICFEPNALERNCPSQRTIVSKNHKILYKHKMISAHKFVGSFFNNFVHEIPYDGEVLYNILIKKHSTVLANHLVCETLDPKSMIGQLYANNLVTDRNIVTMNAYMIQQHKKNKKKLFSRILYKL
jgi:hypothetical protein